MKYFEVYENMILTLNKVEGICEKMSEFYDIVYNDTKSLKTIIQENSKFNMNASNIIKFIEQLNDAGAISDKDTELFNSLNNRISKEIYQVIFAACEKVNITWDVTYNQIIVDRDDSKYLIYESDAYKTVTWENLTKYFMNNDNITNNSELVNRILLFSTDVEKKFYKAYIRYITSKYKEIDVKENKYLWMNHPALLPQYALKNRTSTIKEDGFRKVIHRVDFALILNNKVVLIEINGDEHYSIYSTNKCNFERISNEIRIDRELTLEGYEIYKFLNKDIEKYYKDKTIEEYLGSFFENLFKRHNIKLF